MEAQQKTHVLKNLVELVKYTKNTYQVVNYLAAKDLLTPVEKEYILRKEDDEGKSYELYKFITKKGEVGYNLLTEALSETDNLVSATILKKVGEEDPEESEDPNRLF